MMTDAEIEAKTIELKLQLLESRRQTAEILKKMRHLHKQHELDGLYGSQTQDKNE